MSGTGPTHESAFRFRDWPIRVKLGLLAGVPVLGALVLALVVLNEARHNAARARSLGSVESVAVLSATMARALSALQEERAASSLYLGRRVATQRAGGPDPDALPVAAACARTDVTLAELGAFLADRDTARLPGRLADRLSAARQELSGLRGLRDEVRSSRPPVLETLLDRYGSATARLIGATAALTELTDDGELLRQLTALVALQEFRERSSIEHALLAHVFAADAFPPGSYKRLVTLLTEASTFESVLRTNATTSQLNLLESASSDGSTAEVNRLRGAALEGEEEGLGIDADRWFSLQGLRIARLGDLEDALNRKVREVALAKQRAMQQTVSTSLVLSGGVVSFSLVLGLAIGRGISRSIAVLTEASRRIGQGDLTVRAAIASRDELGALGRAFDAMVAEIEQARDTAAERARLSREMEIAASIQRALLPPAPTHAALEFEGRMLPADEVGGDFYDVLHEPKSGDLWITVGDVSSHGLASGLVMMMTQVAFASQFQFDPSAPLDRVLGRVNELLREAVGRRLQDDKYVTALVLRHEGDGRFQCAGGHQAPLVYRARRREIEVIQVPGPWLGVVEQLPEVPLRTLELEVDDVLCLYSDGIIEARDEGGCLFDLHRLTDALARAAGATHRLSEIADRVLAEVTAFAARRDDDWTLLLIRRLPHSSPGSA